MAGKPHLIVLIEDDPAMRESIASLLRSVGLRARSFASVEEFKASGQPERPTCLVVDVRLPGRSGLELQRDLMSAGIHLPMVFITAHADVLMSVQAMKQGAIDFLGKPFRDQTFLDAIRVGIERDAGALEEEESTGVLRSRFDSLTAREREVLDHVVRGRPNKRIARDIGIAEITVKFHRGNMMRKMRASSLCELTRMADQLGQLRKDERTASSRTPASPATT